MGLTELAAGIVERRREDEDARAKASTPAKRERRRRNEVREDLANERE